MARRQYKSEKEHPAWKIFHWLFEIYVPAAFTHNPDAISAFGMQSSGNTNYDTLLAGEKTKVMWPISKMAQQAENGCPICLIDPSNAETIHSVIMEYLEVWSSDIEDEFGHLSLEEIRASEKYQKREKDVQVLEAFAEFVYPVAKSNVPKALQPNSLLARLRGLSVFKQPDQAPTTRNVVSATAPTTATTSIVGGQRRGTARWQ